MARLPQPGGDSGNWGTILNDYLAQSLKSDGTIKDNAVTSSALAPNSVTATNIPNGTVTEPLLSSAVQTKLNNPSGVPDASPTTKGIVQLAGDLAGTAASPTVPGLSGKEPTITAGTTSQYYRGDKSFQTLDKSAVGLANVDNTSDANKPVSTATTTALNAKLNTAQLDVDGTLAANSDAKLASQKATKTYVDTQVATATTPDATAGTKGKLQLAGDLGGTAASPTVPGLAGKYTKPGAGIPSSDLTAAVQTSLGKADTALQSIADDSVTRPKLAPAVRTELDTYLDQTEVDARVTAVGDPIYAPMVMSNGVWPLADPVSVFTMRGVLCDPTDVTGQTIWFVHSGSLLYKSTDGGNSVTPKALPANISIGYNVQRILRFGGNLYLEGLDDSNACKIWKSSDDAASWSPVLTMTTGSLAFAYNFSTDGTYLYLGEYGDPLTGATPSAKVYRSSDGTTWTPIMTHAAGVRHVHCIAADPYTPGTVYMAVGDNVTSGIWKSTNSGASYSAVPGFDSTRLIDNLTFSPDWIYASTDNAHSDLIVIDRATLTPRNGTIWDHRTLSVPNAGTYRSGSSTNASTIFNSYGPDYIPLFTVHDVGRHITGTNIPTGTTIASYTNGNQVDLSVPATGTGSTLDFTIDRPERFIAQVRHGAVDPQTGIYYFATSEDAGTPGNAFPRGGLFCVPYPGGPIQLIAAPYDGWQGMFIENGRLLIGAHVYKPFR